MLNIYIVQHVNYIFQVGVIIIQIKFILVPGA